MRRLHLQARSPNDGVRSLIIECVLLSGKEPQRGCAFVPKKGLDTGNCEIMRFLRLTQNAVEPVTYVSVFVSVSVSVSVSGGCRGGGGMGRAME